MRPAEIHISIAQQNNTKMKIRSQSIKHGLDHDTYNQIELYVS